MKKIFSFVSCLVALTMTSCSNGQTGESAHNESQNSTIGHNQKREYVFVETVETRNPQSTYERPPIIIRATSDTAAFLIAYRNQCITEALYINNNYNNPRPKSVRVYDDTGADITGLILQLSKADQDALEKRAKDTRAAVFKEYSVKESEY